MTETRKRKIENLVRAQIRMAVEEDLAGGENLMKEVWEELEGDDDFAVAYEEMRNIISALQPSKPPCKHKKAIRTSRANQGNYDPSADHYWYEFLIADISGRKTNEKSKSR